MKHAVSILSLALLASVACGALPLVAAEPAYEVEYTNEKPLIVVRFNQRYVMYERPLYNTISSALSAKADAMFDVVCITPKAHDAHDQTHYNQVAQQNCHKVLGTLQEMGLPQSRMNVTNASDSVAFNEVRIFVR